MPGSATAAIGGSVVAVAGLVVEVRGLRVAYGKVVVLDQVDLSASRGEIVAVTGVNGAGKSTLLSCLAGLRRPSGGQATVLGGPPRDTADFWRRVVFVADLPTWYPGLTAREHLDLVRLANAPADGWCMDPADLIDAFGLASRADAVPLTLSSGQRQRLSLAAALARPSDLLLLDEPEQSLDASFRGELARLLREAYAPSGGTVIMATHDDSFATVAGARRVVIEDGTVAPAGPGPVVAGGAA
ncbi:MAG TPA: ABC transporter ATP-binding protein [Trebonia sp.]|jgi:ABC-type multidrug transport system ATPase subunit|nr:ABC transporter ATP-binding protein [Trebonia sp.]